MPTSPAQQQTMELGRDRVIVALGAGDLDGMTVRQVAAATGLGRTTVERRLNELASLAAYHEDPPRTARPLVVVRDNGPRTTGLWRLTNVGERQFFAARRRLHAAGIPT